MMHKNNKKIRTVKKQLTTKQNIREKQKFVLWNLLQNLDFFYFNETFHEHVPEKCCLARSENGRFQQNFKKWIGLSKPQPFLPSKEATNMIEGINLW